MCLFTFQAIIETDCQKKHVFCFGLHLKVSVSKVCTYLSKIFYWYTECNNIRIVWSALFALC